MMLLYQYAYYWMIELQRGTEEWVCRCKAFCAMSMVETCAMGIVWGLYIIFAKILGCGIHKSHTIGHFPLVVTLPFFSAILLVNYQIIAPKKRVEYYKKVFDGWDKQKYMRWKVYVIFFVVSEFVASLLLGMASRKMLLPD